MTNEEKFKEVFGEKPYENEHNKKYMCPPLQRRGCKIGQGCKECLTWWNQEYEKNISVKEISLEAEKMTRQMNKLLATRENIELGGDINAVTTWLDSLVELRKSLINLTMLLKELKHD